MAGLCSVRSVPQAAVPAEPDPAAVDGPLGPPVEEWIAQELIAYQTGLALFELRRIADVLEQESAKHGLSRELVLAVIRTESGFYNWARSPVGALGLMQIMPATGEMLARELAIPWAGPSTLFDPVVNVRLGIFYLAQLHRRYGSWGPALAAYNWGPGVIDRRLLRGHRLPAAYTTRILAALPVPTRP
jgi:soluble lytic murein transglycosylase-like protein